MVLLHVCCELSDWTEAILQNKGPVTGTSMPLLGFLKLPNFKAGRAGAMLTGLALLTPLLNCSSPPYNKSEIIVAAASDLAPAFEELGRMFEQETGVKVVFSFGSTGTLAKQIENGAPIDLFAAANVSFVEDLNRKGLTLPETQALYARGRIAIWTRSGTVRIETIEELAKPGIKHVAIANPDHAPYGAAAKEALRSAGIYDAVASRLVLAENVRQALQYAETGNADAAITALSLSILSDGQWVLIPEELHRPLDQALVVIKGAAHELEARRLALFINGEHGRPVMRKYGFVLPGE